MKYILLIIVAAAIANGCKKGQADVNVVLNISNGSYSGTLDGVEVTVNKYMSGTGDIVSVGTYTSDANGQVRFSTKRDKFDYLNLTIDKSNFFGIEEKIYLSDVNVNDDNVFAYSLVGKSWAAIHIRSSVNGNNVIIHKNGGKTGCDECCPSVDIHFFAPIDTTFYCINNANTSFSYEYFINGGSSAGQKTGITAFADSTEILLDF